MTGRPGSAIHHLDGLIHRPGGATSRLPPPPPVRLFGEAPGRRLVIGGQGAGRGFVAWRRRHPLPAGWPLKYLLIGFPLWWALGLGTLIFLLLALPMALELRKRERILLPPAFWMWGLFLAWRVVGLLLLGLSPPGTHPGSVSGRVISLAFSAVEYAAVTITLLYVGNLRTDKVPQSAIGRWMGWFFLTVFAGGFLGIIAPSFSFPSVIELMLPHRIAAQAFVRTLVHPVAAQVQDVIGTGNGRPAAPFGYTNSWGNALSILVVWFVAAWVVPAVGAKRLLYAGIVAATVVPVILSLNRGLWIGIAFTILLVLGRQLFRGHFGIVLAVFAVTAAAAVLAAASPLASVITSRLQHGVSDNIRQFVAQLSVVAIKHSPIVGYGGTRHADGSPSSIAIGPSPNCLACGDVPTGSTGQLWSVLFDQGVGGALLYFGFFAAALWIYRRNRGPINDAALITVALGFVYMLFYSALPVAPALTMIAVGVLWRDGRDDTELGHGKHGARGHLDNGS